MGVVLHLLMLLCFFTCLCITQQSGRLICVAKPVEGPDVPLQNTKPKSSPDNYSKAPRVEMHMYTYTSIYSRTGFISIFVVFLSLSSFLPLPARPPAPPCLHTINEQLPLRFKKH